MVVLDEPCSGVDTKARRNIWELISVLRKGRAVVLATHYLDEAEHLSNSILIMKEVGRSILVASFSVVHIELFAFAGQSCGRT